LKGLMMAMMSFMAFPLMVARWPRLSSKIHAMLVRTRKGEVQAHELCLFAPI
jgi:hypothetical protein